MSTVNIDASLFLIIVSDFYRSSKFNIACTDRHTVVYFTVSRYVAMWAIKAATHTGEVGELVG